MIFVGEGVIPITLSEFFNACRPWVGNGDQFSCRADVSTQFTVCTTYMEIKGISSRRGHIHKQIEWKMRKKGKKEK